MCRPGNHRSPVHKTHWFAIVGAIVGALGVLTAVALIVSHPYRCADLLARACLPPPPPALSTATRSSAGGGQTMSTNTFSVQLLPGWVQTGQTDTKPEPQWDLHGLPPDHAGFTLALV
jgi:hypothetical protein